MRLRITLGTVFLATFLIGCAVPLDKQADKISNKIQLDTVQIDAAVDNATAHIKAADTTIIKVAANPATTQPSRDQLNAAHKELALANGSLVPISKETKDINDNAVAADKVTHKATTALVTEQNHWLGAKLRGAIRTVLLIVVGLGAVVGVIAFFAKTTGLTPVVTFFSTVFSDLATEVWAWIKDIAVLFGHFWTGGLAYFGKTIKTIYTDIHNKL